MSVICLLCKEREVYYIKSHLTPAGITENTYGKRNEELIYTIDAQNKNVDKYFGRDYPQNETIEIKDAPNARKGIFCKKCETDFGTYEDAVQNKLIGLINGIGHSTIGYETKLEVKYSFIDIHPNILTTFFLSVVWRQCTEQVLDNKDNPLNPEQFEKLRNLILINLSIPLKEIIQKAIIQNPKLTILTTYNTKIEPTYVNPHPKDTNPLIFFIGQIVLLYWLNDNITNEFEKTTLINQNILVDELTLDKSKIGIINQGAWRKVHNVVAKILANQFLE
jgi:hypothetical protein